MTKSAKPAGPSGLGRFNRPRCWRFVLVALASGFLAQAADAQDRTVELLRT